ncbi:MAG: hypothetical protein F4X59_18060 [Holophagales bacterium]|nr:hypothetical protein [Holophagales bacterium]
MALLLTAASVSAQEVAPESADLLESSERELIPLLADARSDRSYTWRDGDRSRTVYLDPELVIAQRGAAVAGEVLAEPGFGVVLRLEPENRVSVDGGLVRTSSASGTSVNVQPVFRATNGAAMALPGDVLLILDPGWSSGQVAAFLARNGVEPDLVGPLGEIPNGFLVSTGPGFASLDLANALAEQDGVVVSSPNWWREHVTR